MSQTPTPPCPPPEKPRCWFTWRKLSVGLLFLFGFLGYTAYTLKETYLVTAAHTGVGIISGQLILFAARSQPEPLTLETAITLLQQNHWDVATDGTLRYNLTRMGGRFVIFTHVLREGFFPNRVVVVHTREKGSRTLPEAEFIARKKAGNL